MSKSKSTSVVTRSSIICGEGRKDLGGSKRQGTQGKRDDQGQASSSRHRNQKSPGTSLLHGAHDFTFQKQLCEDFDIAIAK